MIAAPSIAMIAALAMLSLFAATILSRRWMRYTALGIGIAEIVMLAILLFAIRT